MKKLQEPKFEVNGVWKKFPEYPSTRAMCLQIIVAKRLEDRSTLAGVIGGYCGDGLFCLEQFVAKTNINQKTSEENIKSLWIGSEDIKTGEEIDFNTLPPHVLDTCHQALEELWEWNSENNWLESQQLRLYPYCLEGLQPHEGLLQSKKTKNSSLLKTTMKLASQSLMLVSPKLYKTKKEKSKEKEGKDDPSV